MDAGEVAESRTAVITVVVKNVTKSRMAFGESLETLFFFSLGQWK